MVGDVKLRRLAGSPEARSGRGHGEGHSPLGAQLALAPRDPHEDHSRPIPFRRRFAYAAIGLLATVLVSDGLLGITLHLIHAPGGAARRMFTGLNNLDSHPEYIWTYIPGSRVKMSARGLSQEASINQDSLRDDPGRPAGKYFLALGDSFTFGWLVSLEHTWHKKLAALLSENQGPPIASVNLGMWMSTFSQHYLRLREMLERYPHPEFVVHLVYPSHIQTIAAHVLDYNARGDIIRTRSLLLHIKDHEMFYGADRESLLERKPYWPYSFWLVRRQWLKRKFAENYERVVGPLEKVNDLKIYSGDDPEVFAAAWEKAERSLAATARLLRARGIPYVVAIIPRDVQVAQSKWNGQPPDQRILHGDNPQQKFLAICRSHGIQCLDLLSDFRAVGAGPRELYFPTDPHWTPAGHELAASRLARFIQHVLASNPRWPAAESAGPSLAVGEARGRSLESAMHSQPPSSDGQTEAM